MLKEIQDQLVRLKPKITPSEEVLPAQPKEERITILGNTTPLRRTSSALSAQASFSQTISAQPVSRDTEQDSMTLWLKDNRETIDNWHNFQTELICQVKQVHPTLREALKEIMSLSDKITEQFVIKFANSYIRLYNLIHDGITEHRETAKSSVDINYQRIVKNLEVYCSAILKHLSALGV